MEILKNHLYEGAFACTAIAMCLLLDWDKNAVKCFISGGVIATWLTMKLTR